MRLSSQAAAVAVILLLLAVVPPFLGVGLQYALINALIASLFAAAFNLLMGQGGMLSFGHAAYYGLGAFAVLHLMVRIEAGLVFPTVLLPLAGGLAGAAAGLVAGLFATKRSGVYFSLVTLALAELLRALAPHWQDMFGGEAGLSSMRMPSLGISFGSPLQVYYLTLAWTVPCLGLLYAYTRTPFGRLTLALRDNEQRVRFLGYDAHATKTLVFAISALFSGIAGGLLAVANETANYNIFSTHVSAQVVLQTFVGGSTVFLGPVLGASLLALFTFLVAEATRSWLLYQGLLFVLVVLFVPQGLGGVVAAHLLQRRALPWRRLLLPYAAWAAAALLIAGGVVFTIQSLEIVCSETYRAAAAKSGAWAPYALFGRQWVPAAPLTWAAPATLLGGGLVLLRRAAASVGRVWSALPGPVVDGAGR